MHVLHKRFLITSTTTFKFQVTFKRIFKFLSQYSFILFHRLHCKLLEPLDLDLYAIEWDMDTWDEEGWHQELHCNHWQVRHDFPWYYTEWICTTDRSAKWTVKVSWSSSSMRFLEDFASDIDVTLIMMWWMAAHEKLGWQKLCFYGIVLSLVFSLSSCDAENTEICITFIICVTLITWLEMQIEYVHCNYQSLTYKWTLNDREVLRFFFFNL